MSAIMLPLEMLFHHILYIHTVFWHVTTNGAPRAFIRSTPQICKRSDSVTLKDHDNGKKKKGDKIFAVEMPYTEHNTTISLSNIYYMVSIWG